VAWSSSGRAAGGWYPEGLRNPRCHVEAWNLATGLPATHDIAAMNATPLGEGLLGQPELPPARADALADLLTPIGHVRKVEDEA